MADCFLYNCCNHKDCDKEFCIRKYKITNIFKASLIPENKWVKQSLKIDEDGTDYNEFLQLADIDKNIVDFIKSGKNIYLHSSNCGNGKTSWALRLAGDYITSPKIWPKASNQCLVLFISVPRLLLSLKEDISKKSDYVSYIKKNVLDADLVIWDDIAAKVGTEFELTHLFNFIDTRIARKKSNIYTSNLNPIELDNALEARLKSRVCYENVIDIELHGADKRFLSNKEAN